MGQLSDDDDEGLGDLLYSGPGQFDPVSGAVITSQVEEVAGNRHGRPRTYLCL